MADRIRLAKWRVERLVLVLRAELLLISKMLTNPDEVATIECELDILDWVGGQRDGLQHKIICDFIDSKIYYNSPTDVAGVAHVAGELFDALNVDMVVKALKKQALEWVAKNG
jgi:hypothetical protein